MNSLQLLLVILPLGLDTLAISVSQGIKSPGGVAPDEEDKPAAASYGWLRLALLFSVAETLMPLVGLGIGYAVTLVVSNVMHYAGPLLLIGVGAWELWEEAALSLQRRKRRGQPLLLALGVSLDELAIGFSLGSLTAGKAVSPLLLCLLIGLQGFLLAVIGLWLGRTLRARLKPLQEGSEYLSAFLLIGLGIWLFFS